MLAYLRWKRFVLPVCQNIDFRAWRKYKNIFQARLKCEFPNFNFFLRYIFFHTDSCFVFALYARMLRLEVWIRHVISMKKNWWIFCRRVPCRIEFRGFRFIVILLRMSFRQITTYSPWIKMFRCVKGVETDNYWLHFMPLRPRVKQSHTRLAA